MKILFLALSDDIHDFIGSSVHIRELAKSFSDLGHSVHLVVGYNKTTENNCIDLPDVSITYVKNKFPFVFPKSLFFSKILILSKIIRKFRPDLIYERNFNCTVGSLISIIYKIPLLVEINGLVDDEIKLLNRSKNSSKVKLVFSKWIRKISLNKATTIIAVTNNIKAWMEYDYNIPSEKIKTISNGANVELFRPMDKDKCKKELNLSLKNRYVSFVGNLAPWQGVDYLIKAAPLVIEAFPETRFLIVGDGLMRQEWENMVEDSNLDEYFLFTGPVPFNIVAIYINATDLCVAPFIRDRNEKIGLSPLKIYEYLACGKPVVASDILGVGDVLQKENVGLSFPSEDYIEFANKMKHLLSDDKLNAEMGNYGRELVVKKYSWARVAENILEVHSNER